ncbi:hypothetical protein ACLOJK_028337 [Asimina triloba]
MWRELSELERVCLIDGCASQVEYRYHMLGERVRLFVGHPPVRDSFGTSRIMSEEECRRVIAARKRLEETGVAQVSRKTLRPDANVPSEWEFLKEALAKARNMARERLEVELEQRWAKGMAEGERRFFFQLLEMGRHANPVEALQEQAEGAVLEILSVLDVTRAEQDEACNDAEGVSLAKQDLERALADVEASIRGLSDQHAREETSRLLFELSAVKVERDKVIDSAKAAKEEASQFSTELVTFRFEAEALRARGVDLDVNGERSRAELKAVRGEVSMLQEEVELLAESEVARTEVAQLRAELKASRADVERLQVALSQGGDALFLGSISANSRAPVIAEYLQATFSGVQRSLSVPTTPGVDMVSLLAGSRCVKFAEGLALRLCPAALRVTLANFVKGSGSQELTWVTMLGWPVRPQE